MLRSRGWRCQLRTLDRSGLFEADVVCSGAAAAGAATRAVAVGTAATLTAGAKFALLGADNGVVVTAAAEGWISLGGNGGGADAAARFIASPKLGCTSLLLVSSDDNSLFQMDPMRSIASSLLPGLIEIGRLGEP